MLAAGTRIDPPVAAAFTTGGETGTAVTFPAAVSAATYHVTVIPTANPSGGLGEIWITGRTTAGCTIHNSGNAGITATYAVTVF